MALFKKQTLSVCTEKKCVKQIYLWGLLISPSFTEGVFLNSNGWWKGFLESENFRWDSPGEEAKEGARGEGRDQTYEKCKLPFGIHFHGIICLINRKLHFNGLQCLYLDFFWWFSWFSHALSAELFSVWSLVPKFKKTWCFVEISLHTVLCCSYWSEERNKWMWSTGTCSSGNNF